MRVLNIDEFYSSNSFKVDDSFLDKAVAFLRACGYEASHSKNDGMWVLAGRFSWLSFGPIECSTANKLRVLSVLDLEEDQLFNYKWIFVNTDEHDSAKVELTAAGYTFVPMDVLSPGRFKIRRPEPNRNRQDTKDYGSISRDQPNAFVFSKEGLILFAMRTAESMGIDFGSDDFTGISAQGSLMESREYSFDSAYKLLKSLGCHLKKDGERLFVQSPYIAFYSGHKRQVNAFRKKAKQKMKELGIPLLDCVSPNGNGESGTGAVYVLPYWPDARRLANALMEPDDLIYGILRGSNDYKYYFKDLDNSKADKFVGSIWVNSDSKILGMNVTDTQLREIYRYLSTKVSDWDEVDGSSYASDLMEASGIPDSDFPKIAGTLSHFGIKVRKTEGWSPKYVLDGVWFATLPSKDSVLADSLGSDVSKLMDIAKKASILMFPFQSIRSRTDLSSSGIVFFSKGDIDRFFDQVESDPYWRVNREGRNIDRVFSYQAGPVKKLSLMTILQAYSPSDRFKPIMTGRSLIRFFNHAVEVSGNSIGGDEAVGRYSSDSLLESNQVPAPDLDRAVSFLRSVGYDTNRHKTFKDIYVAHGKFSWLSLDSSMKTYHENKERVLNLLDLKSEDLVHNAYIFANPGEFDKAKDTLTEAGYKFSQLDPFNHNRFCVKTSKVPTEINHSANSGYMFKETKTAFSFTGNQIFDFAIRVADSMGLDFWSDEITGMTNQGFILESVPSFLTWSSLSHS